MWVTSRRLLQIEICHACIGWLMLYSLMFTPPMHGLAKLTSAHVEHYERPCQLCEVNSDGHIYSGSRLGDKSVTNSPCNVFTAAGQWRVHVLQFISYSSNVTILISIHYRCL